MIDWTKPYSCTWRVFRVDEVTWADGQRIDGLTNATVTKDVGGKLIESGSMTFDMPMGQTLEEGYYRIVMTATQNGVSERVDIATLHCASTSDKGGRGRSLVTVKGSSVLYPASTESAPLGGYIPAGVNGAEYSARLLSKCLKAPVSYEGSFVLDTPIVYQQDWHVLDCALAPLGTGGYVAMIDGRGSVSVVPEPSEPVASIGPEILGVESSGGTDWSVVHNRYYAIEGSNVALAVNDDPNSVTSTTYRGYNSDLVDRSPKRVNGETLNAYARRMLVKDSTLTDSKRYTREWVAGVYPSSLVRMSASALGMSGIMRVKSQKLTLGKGVKVEEIAGREVASWLG